MAKARLLEAQSPAVQTFTPPGTASDAGATGIGAIPTFVALNPSGRWATGSELVQRGRTGTPTSRSTRLAHRGIRDGLRGASPTVTECP